MNSQPQNWRLWDVSGYLPPELRPGRTAAGFRASARGAADVRLPRPPPGAPRNPSSEFAGLPRARPLRAPRPPCTRARRTLDTLVPLSSAHPRPGHRTRTEAPLNPSLSLRAPEAPAPSPDPWFQARPYGHLGAPRLPGSRLFLLTAAAGTGAARVTDRSRRAPRPCSPNPLGAPPTFGSVGERRHLVSRVGPAKAGQGGGLGTAVGAAAP